MWKVIISVMIFAWCSFVLFTGNGEVKEAVEPHFIVYGTILADQPQTKSSYYAFCVKMGDQIIVFRENPGKPKKLGPLLRPGLRVKFYCDKSNIVDYSEHSTIKYGGDVTLENIIKINGMDVRKSADKNGD